MIDGCDVDLVGEVARNGGAVNADDTARSVVSMAIVDFSMVCSLLCFVLSPEEERFSLFITN